MHLLYNVITVILNSKMTKQKMHHFSSESELGINDDLIIFAILGQSGKWKL